MSPGIGASSPSPCSEPYSRYGCGYCFSSGAGLATPNLRYNRRVAQIPPYSLFTPASPAASRVKRKNRREGGRAELSLRLALWHSGFRYRKHLHSLPGKPDLVFSGARLCVFVDGDFWHGRNWPDLRLRLQQRANPDYWIPKIARNIDRDREQDRLLANLGWRVLRLWETDILANVATACQTVAQAIVAGPSAKSDDTC